MKYIKLSILVICAFGAARLAGWAAEPGTDSTAKATVPPATNAVAAPPTNAPAASTATSLAATNASFASTTNKIPAVTGGGTNSTTAQSVVAATNLVTLTNSAPATNLIAKLNLATNAVAGIITDHSIRFQFDGIAYTDVIKRFTQMVNKPLMGDQTVEGTLTFTDPKPYTYPEAFEMLNLILAMKGVMLVEMDRYFRVVQLKELPQMPIRIFRGLDQTGDVRPGEVITVVLNLKNLEAAEITQAVTTMLSNAGSVAPLSRGRGIIITDRLANILRVQNLLNEVDTASPVQRQMKTFTILNASGVVLTDLINRTFGIATAPKRVEFNQQTKTYHQLPPDATDYITAIFDEASHTLVLFGPADRMGMAEDLIKRFETENGAKASEVRIIYPRSTPAFEMAQMIRQSIPNVASENESPSSMAVKARLVVDATNNRLIVTAPLAGQLDAIDELVKKVDAPIAGVGGTRLQDGQVTKVIRCRTADPDTIVRILLDAFARPGGGPPSDNPPPRFGQFGQFGRGGLRMRGNSTVRISLDPNTRNIILIGSAAEVQQAVDIVNQLDMDQPEKRVLRVFPLKSSRSTDFATKVQRLYQDQIKNHPGTGMTDALIMGDDASRRLIVTATEAHLKLIEALVNELDAGDSTTRQLKSITLKNASATSVAAMISQWFSRPSFRNDDPTLRVFVTASQDDQTVIVEAAAQTLARIEDVIRTLDVAPTHGTFEVRTYQITGANAAELSQTLSRLFTQRMDNRQRYSDTPPAPSAPQPRFEAEFISNSLLVAATKDQFEQIEQIIKDLKTSAEVAQVVKIVPCRNAEPETMVKILTDAFTRPGSRGRMASFVKVTLDYKTRNLILVGTQADVQRAIEIINQLDSNRPEKRTLRIFTLKTNRSDEFGRKIQQLYQDQIKSQPGADAADALFMGEPFGNRLIITATESQMTLIENLVKELDATIEPTTRQLKSIVLKHTSANAVASMISQLFSRQFQMNDPNLRVIVTASPDDQTLVVEATALTLSRIEEVIKSLDVEPERLAFEVRTYQLVGANVEDLTQKLARLFGQRQDRRQTTETVMQPRFEADGNSSTIIVAATKEQFPQIEQLIKDLSTSVEVSQITKIIPCRSASPDILLRILTDTFNRPGYRSQKTPTFRIILDPKTRNLILIGTPQEVQKAIEIVNQLDSDQPEKRNLRIFTIKSDRSAEFASKIQQLYQDQLRSQPSAGVGDALIMGDAYGNRLIVTATDNHMKLIEGLITQLDASPEGTTRQLKTIQLKHNSANAIASMITQLFNRQIRSDDPNLRVIATAAPDDQSLLIEATAMAMARIEGVIQDLDVEPERAAFELRTYHLVGANVEELTQKLARLFTERQDRRRQDAVPVMQPRFEADTTSSTLIVAASKEQFTLIDQLIKELRSSFEVATEIRTFKLQYSTADQMAQLLETMLSEDGASRQNRPYWFYLARGTASEVNKLRIVAAPSVNAVVIQGPPQKMSLAEELIKTLDKPDTDNSGRQLKVISVKNTSANGVASMLTQLFGRQMRNDDPNRVLVTASPNDQAIVLEAPAPVLKRIMEVVQTLDVEPERGAFEVRTYHLEGSSVDELTQALSRLCMERQDRRRRDTDFTVMQPRFEADTSSSSIIVAATKDQFIQIEQLIKELRASFEVATEIRTFKLQYATADQMVELLQTMLTDESASSRQNRPWYYNLRQNQTDTKKLRITTAPNLNAVIVQGPPQKLNQAEQLIKTLDKPETDPTSTLQTVHLKKGTAEGVAEAVNKTLAARVGANRTKRVNVTPVSSSNSLLIDGPSSEVKEVLQIIQELDKESSQGLEFRIYKLENGTAREMSRTLSDILRGMPRRRARYDSTTPDVPTTVTADERTNSLIVSATPEVLRFIDQLLPTLDKSPERTNRNLEYYWLVNADAFDVVSKIETLYEDRPKANQPTVEADLVNNAVTVVANKADLLEIEEMIRRLDEMAVNTSLQVRLVPINKIPATQMAAMLQSLYSQMSTNEVRIVDKLPSQPKEKPPFKTSLTPRTATNETSQALEKSGATNAMAIATNQPSPPVIIAVDKTANVLLLSGPSRELDLIQSIIRDLSLSASSEDELRMFPLKEADPIAVARTLNQLFQQPGGAQPAPGNQPGQRGGGGRRGQQAQGPQRQGQGPNAQQGQPAPPPPPRVAVVAEPRTRSVIIRAKPTDFTLFESLIKQLDVAGLSAELAFRLVPLENARADKLLPLVTQMVTQLNLARPGDTVSVIKDPRGDALFIVSRASLLDQIETMVKELDKPSGLAESDVLMIPLKNAQAGQLAAVIQDMLRPGTPGGGGGGGGGGFGTSPAQELQEQVRRLKIMNDRGDQVLLDLTKPIKVVADPAQGAGTGSNRIILSSTPDNLKALAAIVAMMDTVPIMEGISAKLVHLKNADATTASQTLNSIFQQGQRMLSGPGGGGQGGGRGGGGRGLASPLNVAVDLRSNTLIISGKEESIALAQNIIDQLDQTVEAMVTEVKLFHLKYAAAATLAPLLQSVFAESRGGAMAGTPGLRAQVSRLQTVLGKTPPKTTEQPQARAAVLIQAADPANILIVAARSDVMPLIEDVISTMDIPEASGMDNIRIYPLQHGDAATLQKLLTDLFRGAGGSQGRRQQDRAMVTIDQRTNALIVSGNESVFGIVASLLDKLDQPLPEEFRNVHIIPLENADAVSIATTLQRLVDARLTQKSGAGKQESDSLRITVIPDARSNSLLVGGSKDGFALIQSLASELDKANSALLGQIRLVPLKHATAQTLSSALSTLFAQRAQAARTPDLQRNRPVIVPDPRGNSLLIAAGTEDGRAIDGLIEKLDRIPENPAVLLTVIGLRHNDSQQVATMLAGVFTARHQSLTAPGQPPVPQDLVHIEADALSNALVISANAENLALIKELLTKVDVEPAAMDGLIQAFTLKQADAQRVANMLSSLITQGIYRPGMSGGAGARRTARDAIAVTVDQRSNTLIVSASPENLLVIKELIKQIDSQANVDAGDIQLFALQHARASQLATVLQQFFLAKRTSETTGGAQGQRSVPVTVTPDDRTNTLLVTGGKETFAAIQRMIAQLDVKDILSKTSFQVFGLKQTTAGKLQSTLTQLFAKRPSLIKGQPPEPITLVADVWANALIVGAAPEDMPMVESLIEQLDNDHNAAGTEVQVLQLAKGDARKVAQTLTALYNSGGPGVASAVTINVDERVNAVVVSAGLADLKRISELVKKLDTDQVANVSEIRIFGLKNARAVQLATMLTAILNTKPTDLTGGSPSRQSLLQFITRTEAGKELLATALKEGILITPDPRTNSLIVSAPVDYMNMLEQLITRLDSNLPQMAKIKVFNLLNADARQMSTMLQSVFRLQRTGTQIVNDRAVQYTLVKPSGSGQIPGLDDDAAGASATMGTDEDTALTINVDLRTNSLIVGGTEHYVALAAQLIESLDSSTAQERISEVYILKNSRATDIQNALSTFTKQDQAFITAAGGGAQAMTQELLDREIAIVAETNSNTLLISGSPRYLVQIKSIIEQLDQPQLQVLIQVLVAEVTLDTGDDLGVEWTYQTKGNPATKSGADLGIANALKTTGGYSSAISGNNFTFLFRALQSESRLQVLSRPQIVAVNNQPAHIKVTQQVPLVTSSQVVGLTGNVQNQFQYQDVGVILQVTPRISPDGFVKLDIQTTNSQLSATKVAISANFEVPVIQQRSAQTTVSVQSGQSILIGGLIKSTDNITTKRFPFLGSIPGLGALFRSTSKTINRTELLVLLTPQVLVLPKEQGSLGNLKNITREQLDKSTINDKFNKDDVLQRRILEPIYPDKMKESAGSKPADKSTNKKAP